MGTDSPDASVGIHLVASATVGSEMRPRLRPRLMTRPLLRSIVTAMNGRVDRLQAMEGGRS